MKISHPDIFISFKIIPEDIFSEYRLIRFQCFLWGFQLDAMAIQDQIYKVINSIPIRKMDAKTSFKRPPTPPSWHGTLFDEASIMRLYQR